MTIDKQKLQKLLLAEAASFRADCADWKRNTEALQEFLGEKTLEEVALELLAENERLVEQVARIGHAGLTIAAEGDELRAENAGLQTGYKAYEQVNAELRAEVARSTEREILQLAEIEALRKDAERYRWLRAENVAGPNIQVSEWIGPHEYQLYTAELDVSIDAAMGQGEQP